MAQIDADTISGNDALKNRHLKKYLSKASNQWSSYLDVESTSTEFQIAETIDDLLIRFDEFEQLVKMIRADTEKGIEMQLPMLRAKYSLLESAFEKVDRLETMVGRINQDVSAAEHCLIQAEATLPPSDSSLQPLKALIRPTLFFSRTSGTSSSSSPVSSQAATIVPYQPLHIFSTEEFFK